MTTAEIIKQLLGLLAGIGVFLIAIKLISANLESIGGNKLKALFAKAARSTPLGVAIGAAATALVQSSGATSVMAIGFVNAGVMSLLQACAIVLGANIGTTITAQIVAFGFLGGGTTLSASVILAALAGVGAFMIYFTKSEKTKSLGGLLAGLGMLFVGLSTMSGSMSVFAQNAAVQSFIASIDFPGASVVLVLAGVVLTAVIQSSSVTSSISITMLVSGLISLDQGIYLILGSNIGACVVALLAGLGASRKAKCVASFHVLENVVRAVSFLIVTEIAIALSGGSFHVGAPFARLFPRAVPFQLSMFHTFYNVVSVLLFIPFTGFFVKLALRFVPGVHPRAQIAQIEEEEEKKKPDDNRLYYIDEHLLKTPPIAVQQTKNEIVNMADLALRNFNFACETICSLDFSQLELFRRNERELNFLNAEITKFAVQLSKLPMSEEDHVFLATAFHSVSDLERIGDYAENIVEYAENLKSSNHRFSEKAIGEVDFVKSLIGDLFGKVMEVYINHDRKALEEAYAIEDRIDDVTDEMAANHIARLDAGVCTPDVGAQYLSLASNAERVADHLVNVANAAKKIMK